MNLSRIVVFALVVFMSAMQGVCLASKDVLVFFDVSGSTKKEVINHYFDQYKNIVNNLKEGDSIACALINSNTRGSFAPFGLFSIKAKGITDSPTGYKEKITGDKNKGLITVKRTLEATKPGGDTDIISALSQSKDYFDRSLPSNKKVLVLFSDMVEETKLINLKDLKQKGVEKAYAKISSQLPPLKGVSIYAVGIEGNSPEGFKALETFWKRAFDSCGAQCVLFSKTLYKFE